MASSKIFTLEGKGLKLDTAEQIEPHIKDLQSDDSVEQVLFLGNTLGIGASEALAKVLSTKKNLQIANFADIFTGRLLSEIPPALDAILQALLQCPNLHTVNLSDNAFGLNTQAPLISFLSAHTPLEHLILNNNGLGPEAGTNIANALTTLAAEKKKAGAPPLRSIVCGRNRLETGSMAAWAKAYEAHAEGMISIRMVQNGIRQEGITTLIREGLSHLTQLQVLDLQDNTFTVMGGKALADVLPSLTNLKELAIGDCLLGARGGVMLGSMLNQGSHKSLEVLRLQYNDIDAKGVKALADAIDSLPKLRRVELNGNKFSEDDVNIERLRDALSERKEAAGVETDDEDENWGVDELDELEDEDSDDEEEEDEVADEEDDERETILKQADERENQKVAQEKDKSVDDLADMLGKTEIKS